MDVGPIHEASQINGTQPARHRDAELRMPSHFHLPGGQEMCWDRSVWSCLQHATPSPSQSSHRFGIDYASRWSGRTQRAGTATIPVSPGVPYSHVLVGERFAATARERHHCGARERRRRAPALRGTNWCTATAPLPPVPRALGDCAVGDTGRRS